MAQFIDKNCRWLTKKEQGQNKRNNRIICINGISRTIAEWARRMGIKESTLRWRIARGIPLDKSIKTKGVV